MNNFHPGYLTKDSELQDILMYAYTDTKLFAKVFFPEIFDLPFSYLHDQIFELIDSDDPKIVIAAPRALGKTSICRTYAAKKIVYQDTHFLTYISNSATSAEMQTENIKQALRGTKQIKDLFGDIKESMYSSGEESFSRKAWIANGYTMILPRGSGQQIRGLNWIRFRPDIFIFDDLEDTETLDNEVIRMKRKVWFYGDAIKAKPTGDKRYKIIYIDTVKHEDSLIEELLSADDWTGIRLSICDDKYKTNAPEFFSQKELDDELKSHRKKHIMDVFARERMSQPISKEVASFKAAYFQYYTEADEDWNKNLKDIESVTIYDPSKSKGNPANAQTGIVTWGVNTRTNALYLRSARGEYLHPEEQYEEVFKEALHYNSRVIGIEVTGLNEFITFPFKNEMHRRGYNFEIIELKARKGEGIYSGVGGGKKARIAAMIPFYRQGLVWHNSANCGPYEQQLMGFPKSKFWDMMDAAAYIIEILEMGLRYFEPKGEDEDSRATVEKEYTILEDKYEDEDYINPVMVNDCPDLDFMKEFELDMIR